jgi:hypothetical protein
MLGEINLLIFTCGQSHTWCLSIAPMDLGLIVHLYLRLGHWKFSRLRHTNITHVKRLAPCQKLKLDVKNPGPISKAQAQCQTQSFKYIGLIHRKGFDIFAIWMKDSRICVLKYANFRNAITLMDIIVSKASFLHQYSL